jgi:hypothetical protein
MKVINYCFSCNKEYDMTGIDVMAKGLQCECGGYYVTPSGKVMSRFIPETDEDYKLLGIGKKIKVWTAYLDGDRGYTVDNPDYIAPEFEEDSEIECSESDIKKTIENAKELKVGEEISLSRWTIKCSEMSQEEYDNLSEFSGW